MLGRLERTWDLLDELGSTPVGDGFTRTTLEMVTVAAEEDVQHVLAAAPVRKRRRRWLVGAGVFAAAAAGFLAAYLALPNPNRQLLEDLPLLENLEEYSRVDDIRFLQLLKENSQALFPKEKDQKETAESAAKSRPRLEDYTKAERMAYIENLSKDKKADLWRDKENFDVLPAAERKKLRDLHEAVQKDKDRAELDRVMHDYYEWWKDQPTFARNELSMLASAQRGSNGSKS